VSDAPELDPNRRRDLGIVCGLLVAFVGVRAVWLRETFGAQSAEPLEFGQLAHDLNAGLLAPLPSYMTQANEGCALFFGAFCAPAVLAVGDSFLTLRLCQLAWHALALVVLCGLARRVGGSVGMALAGALYVLPPPAMASMMHRGWFNHLEAWLLLGAGLLLFAPGRRATLAGVLIGASVYFQLSALPAAAGVVLVLVGTGRGPLLLGVVIGAAPAALGALVGDPVEGSAASDAGFELGASLESARTLLLQHGPDAFGYRSGSAGTSRMLGGAAMLLGGGLAALGAWAGRDRLVVGAAASALAAHLGACVVSGMDLSEGRYLAPAAPWALVLIAAAPRRLLAIGGLAVLLHGAQWLGAPASGMPPSFEAVLRGHSVLEHDGLRQVLPGDGAAAARRLATDSAANWDLCRALARSGAVLPDAPAATEARCRSGWAIGRGEAGDPSLEPRARLGRVSTRLGHEGAALSDVLSAPPGLRAEACVAVGHWAFETGWHGGGILDLARQTCSERSLALGAGVALAPRVRAGETFDAPQLSWWWSDGVEAPVQEAFRCGFAAEYVALEADSLRPLPIACLR
jgi:hypothetical protein